MIKGKLKWMLIGALVLAGCASGHGPDWTSIAEQSHKWGYYSGAPVTKWDSDGRTMTLLSELRYTDPKGEVWVAPAGSVVDGASIPRSLWSVMGGPFEGKYRNASVLHDVSYDQHNRPWEECDRMFYNAMRCSGVGRVEAGTMYYALYKFGHHWKFEVKKAKALKPKEAAALARNEEFPRAIPVNAAEVNDARDWIRGAEPSLEQIEQRADAEAHQ
jgi:Protein of unknown function (DUF1353)